MNERDAYGGSPKYNSVGDKVKFDSEATDIQCPFCNHKLRYRQSPFFQNGCYGDIHWHYYCGKCHEYICEICNPKMINQITGKSKFPLFNL